jgi:hypothetical protein
MTTIAVILIFQKQGEDAKSSFRYKKMAINLILPRCGNESRLKRAVIERGLSNYRQLV